MQKIGLFVISCIILAQAIKIEAVNHNADNLFYVNPWMGEIKLRATRGAVSEAFVLYAGKKIKMNIGFQDAKFDYFTADIGRFDTSLTYQFLVYDKTDSLFLPQTGSYKSTMPVFSIPEWTYGKIYYSILPDGFYNANPSNDPKGVVGWDKEPVSEKEFFYGGDLAGILEKLPYLDSLNFDILLLQPIQPASTNHKYNPKSYASIDSTLGDTMQLKQLINELHKKGKKIILKFIATHTGNDFPAFLDIIKNGESSKYYTWYNIYGVPIRTSPPNYDCWLGDARFPKLNLKDNSAKAFLYGYIDYWLHFGFDGLYIGEDNNIDADFVRELKNFLRKKYPMIVLLGSSENTGMNGFDGTTNRKLTDLIINFFARRTLATSDFDNELHKLLFFNPSQVNLTNLIDLSDFDERIASIIDADNLNLIYAFIFTFCGSPVITFGDEVGKAEGKRFNMGSFPWAIEKQNRTLFEEIKRLIDIRKSNPILSNKYFFTLYVNDINRVYAYDRGGIIVVINSADTPCFVSLSVWNGTYTDLITEGKHIIANQQLKLSIPARSYKILRREF
ncbi:MAG: alpha-amylase family glycosyl hydrolase [bacterium]